jgi:hypothetical protein
MARYICAHPGCGWDGEEADFDPHLRDTHGWTDDELWDLAALVVIWKDATDGH